MIDLWPHGLTCDVFYLEQKHKVI